MNPAENITERGIPAAGFGLTFGELYRRDGLARLDARFLEDLAATDAALAQRLQAARAQPDTLTAKQESELLLALAPHVDDFVGRLFGILPQVHALAARHHELAPLYSVKRLFVQRKAMHKFNPEAANAFDGAALERELEGVLGEPFSELAFARRVTQWQQDETAHAAALELALRYSAWSAHTAAGRERHHHGVLFKVPAKLDYQRLVPVTVDSARGYTEYRLGGGHLRRRDGFELTDAGTDLTGALDETNYCIWCHEQGKDSCSKGLR